MKKLSIKKTTISMIFFTVGLLFLQISSIWVNVVFIEEKIDLFYKLSLLFLGCAAILRLILMNLTKKQLFIAYILIVITLVSYYVTSDSILLQFILIIICCLDCDVKKIIKLDLFLKIFVCIVVIVSYRYGYTDEQIIRRNGLGEIRKSFGFYHPNTFSFYITMIFFECLYCLKDRKYISILLYIAGIGLMIFIKLVPDSRTSVVMIAMFYLLSLFRKKDIFLKNDIVKFIVRNSFIILFIVSLTLTILYNENNSVMTSLDKLFSKRILIQNYYYQEYGITFFGQVIEYVKSLDSVYIKLFLNYGIVSIFMFDYIYRKLINATIKNNDIFIYKIFIIFVFCGLMEFLTFRMSYNIFWIYFVESLRKREINDEKN